MQTKFTVMAFILGVILFPIGVWSENLVEAATLYVSPQGSDSNPGTAILPYKTIQKAANVVNPGDTVIVKDGTYFSNGNAVELKRGGTNSAWVTFKSENPWKAKVDGNNNNGDHAWTFIKGANYIRVEGFEVTDFSGGGFWSNQGGTHLEIVGNHIHNIGRVCTNTTGGLDGMFLRTNNVLIEKNLIHDIGRLADGEGGCNPSNTYYQNHDHGIYIASSTNFVIKNNVTYNINRGWAIHFYHGSSSAFASSNIVIAHNTFVGKNPWRDGQIILATPGLTNSKICNNIFYSPRNIGIRQSGGSYSNVEICNNLTYQGSIAGWNKSGVNFINNFDNVDPLPADPQNNDFSLSEGSPAIDIGADFSGQVDDDFKGVVRPQGQAFDVGAYETGEVVNSPPLPPTGLTFN